MIAVSSKQNLQAAESSFITRQAATRTGTIGIFARPLEFNKNGKSCPAVSSASTVFSRYEPFRAPKTTPGRGLQSPGTWLPANTGAEKPLQRVEGPAVPALLDRHKPGFGRMDTRRKQGQAPQGIGIWTTRRYKILRAQSPFLSAHPSPLSLSSASAASSSDGFGGGSGGPPVMRSSGICDST